MKRFKTDYPGVFYREAKRIGGKGIEKVFYIVFKKDGKVNEEKVGRQYADDMTAARAARIRGERFEGKIQSRKQIREAKNEIKWTIKKIWDAYKANRLGLKGIITDECRFKKHIAPVLGKKEPSELAPLDIDRIRIKLLKTKKPATVRNVLELLRRIINYGVKKTLCPSLPFKIEMPRVDNLKTEDLTSEQIVTLLKTIDEDVHPVAGDIMKLALFTGMRRGEIFKLKWSDIDYERGFISLLDPKGGVDQKIPLNDATKDLLNSHEKTESRYVFPGRGGRIRTDINKAVNLIKKKAGLPADFRPLHGLRHVYASMLASSGQVDMYTLQKLLTHKGPLMTQRYAHLQDETLKNASEVAGNIINGAIARVSKEIRSLKERNN